MDAKQEIISWLRDAYAMERSQEMALEEMSKSDRHSSECRTAAAMHLTETRQHAQLVESMLRSLGSDTSTFKTSVGMIAETMKGLGTALSHDEPIKDLLATYSIENFEIACYMALAAAADAVGLPQVMNTCNQIVVDEQKMAAHIVKALPGLVQEYLGATMAKAA